MPEVVVTDANPMCTGAVTATCRMARASGERERCRPACGVHHSADGGFQEWIAQGLDPEMLSVNNMAKLSKSVSDEDVKAAAAYFSSIPLKPWIRVVEVEQVPKTKPEGGMMVVIDGGGTSRSATV